MPGDPQGSSNLFTLAHQTDAYEQYVCETEYFYDSGKVQLPIAQMGPGDTDPPTPGQGPARTAAAICQVQAACSQKVIRWAVERSGSLPKVPHPYTGDPNDVFHWHTVRTHTPYLADDGVTRIYRLSGVYLYLLRQPVWALDGLPMGGSPIDVTPSSQYIFGQENFDPTLTP